MANVKNISKIYEEWNVTSKHTVAALATSKANNGTFKGGHDCYDYTKTGTAPLSKKRMAPKAAEDFNKHSHNSGIRFYEVAGTEIDHMPKEEVEEVEEVKEEVKK